MIVWDQDFMTKNYAENRQQKTIIKLYIRKNSEKTHFLVIFWRFWDKTGSSFSDHTHFNFKMCRQKFIKKLGHQI